jgi:fatty acid amide hydrolase 2
MSTFVFYDSTFSQACLLTSCGSPLGIGSDIGGSVRIPSLFNGIYGHKPTFNIVSNKGSLPETHGELNEFLVVGPMSKRAKDLRPTFKILASNRGVEKLKLDQKIDMRNLNFYYMVDDGGFPLISPVDKEMKSAVLNVVNHLKDHYGVVAKKVNFSKIFHAVEMWSFKMSAVEEAPTFCEELADRHGKVNPFWELVKLAFGKCNHSFPAVVVGIAEKIAYSQADSKYQRLMIEGCDHLREEFQVRKCLNF